MTKARTLADFDPTAQVAGGKVLQVVKTDLASNSVDKTNNTPATLLTSTSVTLASSSNSLLVEAKISVDLRGGATHNNPEGTFLLYKADGTVLDRQTVYRSGTDNNNEALNLDTIVLKGLYSPSTTSEAPYVQYFCDRGLVRVYGGTSTVGRTSIIATEIAA
mgnify:CR=1 FL=1|tara:strand:+ start:16 stop:501 length:486 start_codon:yes stop_codon:yes gene_type:complete